MRILLELTAPAFFGTAYFMMLAIWEWEIPTILDGIPTFFFGLSLAYPVAAGPSIVYALLMEWAFGRGLPQRGWGQAAFSACLGGIAGLIIAWMLNGNLGMKATGEHPYGLCLVGILSGLTIGLVLKLLPVVQRKQPNPA